MTTPIDPIREALPVVLERMTPGIFAGDLAMFPSPDGKYCRLSDAEAAIAAVTKAKDAEVEALKADAERYRWLRIEGACEQVCNGTWKDLKHAGDLDAAIDAALKEPS